VKNCDNCGRTVTKSFARVYGDNENEVHFCINCRGRSSLRHGAAAGLDVPEFIEEEDD